MSNAASYELSRVATVVPLNKLAYRAIKDAISKVDIYSNKASLRLNERMLANRLGISRTPVRDAIAQLEHDGLLETHPRNGTYIVRKTKREVLDIICAWTKIECTAVALVAKKASNKEIASLRQLAVISNKGPDAHISPAGLLQAVIRFHKRLIELSRSTQINDKADTLFVHLRAVCAAFSEQGDRIRWSSATDPMGIVRALENRNTDLAHNLVKEQLTTLERHVANQPTIMN